MTTFDEDLTDFQFKKDLIEKASVEQLVRICRNNRHNQDSVTYRLAAEQLNAHGVTFPIGDARSIANGDIHAN